MPEQPEPLSLETLRSLLGRAGLSLSEEELTQFRPLAEQQLDLSRRLSQLDLSEGEPLLYFEPDLFGKAEER